VGFGEKQRRAVSQPFVLAREAGEEEVRVRVRSATLAPHPALRADLSHEWERWNRAGRGGVAFGEKQRRAVSQPFVLAREAGEEEVRVRVRSATPPLTRRYAPTSPTSGRGGTERGSGGGGGRPGWRSVSWDMGVGCLPGAALAP